MNDSLEIRRLGPFEVVARGDPVDMSGPKRHALAERLAQTRTASGESWRDQKPGVAAARRELERAQGRHSTRRATRPGP